MNTSSGGMHSSLSVRVFFGAHPACQPLFRQGLCQLAVVEQETGYHFAWSADQPLCVLFRRKRTPSGTAHHSTRSNRAGRCLGIRNEGHATSLGEWVDFPAMSHRCSSKRGGTSPRIWISSQKLVELIGVTLCCHTFCITPLLEKGI